MITLYGFGEDFGLPEISPYVTKTEVQLRMTGVAYVKSSAAPMASPKGQLPWIEDDGEAIADSHFIRLHLERKYGVDFDEGLNAGERAQAWAIERMVENHFGWAMRDEALRQVGDSVRAVGIGRYSEAEVLALGVRSLSALAALLGRKPFMMGSRPTGVDAAAFGMLAGLMIPYFDAPLRRRAMGFANLVAYVDRMMAGAYPEFAWTPLARSAESVAA